MNKFLGQISLVGLVLLLGVLSGHPYPVAHAQPGPSLLFVQNTGQFAADTFFRVYGGPAPLWLTEDALWFTLVGASPVDATARAGVQPNTATRANALKLSFVNANPHPRLEPFNRLDTRVSYFSGSNPARWQTDVPVWGGLRYIDLYPGLNLEITGENGQLVTRLVGSNQAALANIRLQIEGADSLAVDNGQLHVTTAAGDLTLPLLLIEPAQGVNLTPHIEGQTLIQPFTTTRPASSAHIAGASDLIYSTFLGGSSGDEGRAIAVDSSSSAYVAGNTSSTDFPTTPGAFDVTTGTGIAFIAKLNPTGTGLVYATFLDGARAFGLAVDSSGSAYLTGDASTGFPATPGAFDTTPGGSDAFIAKLNPAGTALVYATFLGGSGTELGQSIAVDGSGHAYLTGFTTSADFPATPGAFDTTYQSGGTSGHDVFVAKLNSTGSALAYATFLGGSNDDTGAAIAVDATGSAYITGNTESADFPTTPGAFNTTIPLMFAVKLTPTGSALAYATFLGGGAPESAHAIAIDQTGNAYITGETSSANFPTTPGAFQTVYHSTSKVTYEGDAFVFKLNAAGSAPVYSTFLGGNDHDLAFGLAVDPAGQAYVTGVTYAADFPTTPSSFQPARSGYPDAFMAKLNAAGSGLAYGTFLGGSVSESGYAIAADAAGNAYVTGYTTSANFPTTGGAFDTTLSGDNDAFVSKIATQSGPTPTPTPSPTPSPSPTPTPIPVVTPSPTPPPQTCAPTLLGTITVGSTPRGIALDVARQRVYVANFGSHSVSVLDSSANTVINTITGITSANHIAYDSLHKMLWVTNYASNQVTPIQINDAATAFTVLPPVNVGAGPWGVAFEPVSGYLYVANRLGNSVSVVDVAQRAVAATLTGTFSQPVHLATSPALGGKVYVTNFGNATVTVIKGTAVNKVVNLYDSQQPYGIAVDETRNLVYVATVSKNRIVALGSIKDVPDQFLGWAAFYRGFGDRNRPVPLRVIAVNPDIGPVYDGGHIWTTTSTADASELNQALFISKGWNGYFHVPLAQNVGANPAEGIAVDRVNDRIYVASGASPGTITVLGDHAAVCSQVNPAALPNGANDFGLDVFSRETQVKSDVTGDGQVDIFDLSFIASRYHTTDPTADINGDGLVDIFDLTIAASHYGQTISPGD